jgi:hypothetical protein
MAHRAVVRLQPPRWVDGQIILTPPPRDIYEVLCRDCGDAFGAYETQPEAIRDLRGPYGGREAAERAAQAHQRASATTQRGLPQVRSAVWLPLTRGR